MKRHSRTAMRRGPFSLARVAARTPLFARARRREMWRPQEGATHRDCKSVSRRYAALLSGLALPCVLAALGTARAESGQPRNEIELGVSHERLSRNLPDWESQYLEAVHRAGERRAFYGGARATERFDTADQELWAGLYTPLVGSLVGVLEASASATHRVLPHWSTFGQLEWRLPQGWGLAGGVRRTEYNDVATTLASVGVDRYWGNYRAAYTFLGGRIDGQSPTTSHRITLSRYYGQRSSIGLLFSAGKELVAVGPDLFQSSSVQAVALLARHWLSSGWGVSAELSHYIQGDYYRRTGLRLGLRRSF